MKRLTILLAVAAMALNLSCVDKIQAAKTAVAFIELATETAKQAIDKVAAAKRHECNAKACMAQGLTPAGTPQGNPEWDKCLEKDQSGDKTFQKCYESTLKMTEACDKLWPQISQAQKTAAAVIKAVEAGKGDTKAMVAAVKASVCLGVKLATWVPEKYREKVDMFLALVGAYTCDGSAVSRMTPERQLRVLKVFVKLSAAMVGPPA